MTTFKDSLQAATALERGAEGYMLKSVHPREMKEALKLIYNGGTWIDQSVATRVFENMKRHREQLKKIGSSQGNYPYGLRNARWRFWSSCRADCATNRSLPSYFYRRERFAITARFSTRTRRQQPRRSNRNGANEEYRVTGEFPDGTHDIRVTCCSFKKWARFNQ